MHDPLLEDYYNEDYQDKSLTGPFKKDCAFCNGTGVHPGTMKSMDFERCPACEGQGLVEINADRQDFCTCAQCNGSGIDPNAKTLEYCRVCGGLGIHANN